MEKYFEHNLNDHSKCRYELAVTVRGCRDCLFETLCHLEADKERRESKINREDPIQ